MAEKTGAGGKPQAYDGQTGRYGSGTSGGCSTEKKNDKVVTPIGEKRGCVYVDKDGSRQFVPDGEKPKKGTDAADEKSSSDGKTARKGVETIKQELTDRKVEYRRVQPLAAILSETEIIQRVGGGDLTENGSCSSVAFAYIGNRSGLDVLDFRGGESQKIFSMPLVIKKIAELPGVSGTTIRESNEFAAVNQLLKPTEVGKEYYLSAGEHSAIIRRKEKGFEYLELQDPKDNGFKPLTTDVLKRRFKCQKSHTDPLLKAYGIKPQPYSMLIECQSLGKSEEFKELLEYINTAESGQRKGNNGTRK